MTDFVDTPPTTADEQVLLVQFEELLRGYRHMIEYGRSMPDERVWARSFLTHVEDALQQLAALDAAYEVYVSDLSDIQEVIGRMLLAGLRAVSGEDTLDDPGPSRKEER